MFWGVEGDWGEARWLGGEHDGAWRPSGGRRAGEGEAPLEKRGGYRGGSVGLLMGRWCGRS